MDVEVDKENRSMCCAKNGDASMKIGILVNTFNKGKGMDNVAFQHAIDLKNKGYEVTVYTFESDQELPNIEIIKLKWPKIGYINYLYRLFFPLDVCQDIRFLKESEHLDIVIAHFYPMTFLASLAKFAHHDINYIFCNHGITDNRGAPIIHKMYSIIVKILTNLTLMNVDCIISISKFVEKSIPRNGIRTRVIYNRIDVSKFKYNKDLINPNIAAIAQMQNPKYLYVGIMNYYKGINLLIKSFKSVLKEQPSAKLLLVGASEYNFNIDSYIKYSSLSKRVIYLGRISDSELGYLYDNIDVYTTASTWEGFNLPLVEAQLHGKPVVAYNIGSHEEVVRDKETGILVEPFCTYKFAEAMIQVYKERENMGKKAKEWSYQFSTQNPHVLTISEAIETLIKL